MRHVPHSERRARLAIRHALSAATLVASPEEAARAVVALHATDAPSVYLSIWARTTQTTPADIDRALYDDRTLVKHLAMRRTLFAFPRDLIPAVMPSAAARVASTERTRMARDLERAGIAPDGNVWLNDARDAVTAALATAPALSAAQLRAAVPLIDVVVATTAGETWTAPQVLTLLGAEGAIVRGPSTGRFPTARPLWTLPSRWLGDLSPQRGADLGPPLAPPLSPALAPPLSPALAPPLDPALDAAAGYRELIRRWLSAFGPGTEDDIVWWLGSTKNTVRTALRELGAVEVSLDANVDGPHRGWLLPDDLDVVPDAEPWAALLPPLDPSVMGWKHRDFYLGTHGPALFDSRGNAGTTAWVDGRIVGCWIQDRDATVRVHLLEPVSAESRNLLVEQAARLTMWLDGAVSPTGYRSPAMRDQEREWATRR